MRRPIKEDFDTILDLFSGLDKKKIDIHLALNAVVRIRREVKALNKNLKMLIGNGIVEKMKKPASWNHWSIERQLGYNFAIEQLKLKQKLNK